MTGLAYDSTMSVNKWREFLKAKARDRLPDSLRLCLSIVGEHVAGILKGKSAGSVTG